MPGASRAVFYLTLTEQGRAPAVFQIARMVPSSDTSLDLHGYTTDHVALDGQLIYRPEIDGFEIQLGLVNSSEDMKMRLEVHLELVGEADPRWMIPGLFYNDNRHRDCGRVYPGYSEIRRDPAKFLSNHWSFRSDRTAMPVVFCTTYNAFAFISTEETVEASRENPLGVGMTSLGISAEEGHPRLSVHFPYCEAPVKYSYCHEDRTDPVETYLHLEAKTRLSLSLELGFSPVAESSWERVYRALYQEKWPNHPVRPTLHFLQAEELAAEGLMRWHLDLEHGMIHETTAFDKHFGRRGTNVERQHMHVGWLSGAFPAYTLLWHGRDSKDPNCVRAGTTVINLICSELAPCGTFFPLYALGQGFTAGFGPEDGLAHSRTIAEGAMFVMRAIRLEMQANTMHGEWYDAVRSNLEYILSKQREDGAFPAYYRIRDGHPYSYEGAAGMVWIAPLVAASSLDGTGRFRKAAVKAGEYYMHFLEEGFVYGCVEDLPLVPTADDCHWALICYMLLYELDHDERWLESARKAADLALTFRMTYNVAFAPWTMLARNEFKTRGGDIASVATPTLGPAGLMSFGEMLKLAALTGDSYFRERAYEARVFATQLVARVDGEHNSRVGQTIGQVFYTDWWQPKGMVLSLGHAWAGALVKYMELIERHLNIPTAALEQGDTDSVVQASQSAIVSLGEEIVLPDPVEVRRRRQESQAEDVRPSTTSARPSSFSSEFTSRISQIALGEDSTPSPVAHKSRPGSRSDVTPAPPSRDEDKRPPTREQSKAEERRSKMVPRSRGDEEQKRGPQKTPLASRHVPLPKDEDLGINWHEPFTDEAISSELVPKLDKLQEEGIVPSVTPEPSSGKGILSNLFENDSAFQTPAPETGGDDPEDEDQTTRPFSFDTPPTKAMDDQDKKKKPGIHQDTEDIEIKWKIF